MRPHPGVELVQAEINRIGAVFDGRLRAFPIACWSQQFRYERRGLAVRRARAQGTGEQKKRVCAKPTRKNRHKRRCTRLKKAATLTRTSHAGKNKVKFSGRIGKKALKPARYQLTITVAN